MRFYLRSAVGLTFDTSRNLVVGFTDFVVAPVLNRAGRVLLPLVLPGDDALADFGGDDD